MSKISYDAKHSQLLPLAQALQREEKSEMRTIDRVEGRGIARKMSVTWKAPGEVKHTVSGSERSSLPKLRTRLRRDLDAGL